MHVLVYLISLHAYINTYLAFVMHVNNFFLSSKSLVLHLSSCTPLHQHIPGRFRGAETMITYVIRCINDIVLLKGIVVISLSNPALMLALILYPTLLYMCLTSSQSQLRRLLHNPLSTPCLFDCRMAVTRCMTRKQNHDAYSRKKFSASWSDLSHDVLLLILMKLSIIDFVAFSGVCKTWRSFALSNWNMFMASRRPMTMLISSDGYKKECCLENGDGRKFRTNIPHSSGRTCFGVTCGYLILFGNKTRDFWLVNPITRHELHFPRFPFYVCTDPTIVRGILVFSSSMSGWVFVISLRLSNTVSFSLSGKQAHWTRLFSEFPIHDLHAFQGKIYTLNTGGRLYQVSLNPKPTLTLVVMNNVQNINLIHPLIVSSGKFLYIMDCISRYVCAALQVDLDEMRWVRWRKRGREFAYYVSVSERGVPTRVDMWADPRTQYERFSCFHGDESVSKGCWVDANMYYLPCDCLNVNLMSDKNDELK